MDAEDLVSHDGGKGKAVEDLNEGFEHLGAVLLLDLVVKPIDAGDGGALVVPAAREERGGGREGERASAFGVSLLREGGERGGKAPRLTVS